jgi:glutamine amidotransferase
MITIIDYGMGNLGSIQNMLKRLGVQSQVTADVSRIAESAKLILPGVGAFDAGMYNLERAGLLPALRERVFDARIPILGICLGMQLMTRGSSEGRLKGLAWVQADTVRFESADSKLKVPHMGWNDVRLQRASRLTDGLPDEPRFYFVHSYYVRCSLAEDVLLTATYGHEFHSAFNRDNIWGVQFHPEKSHKYGMQLLKNFAGAC